MPIFLVAYSLQFCHVCRRRATKSSSLLCSCMFDQNSRRVTFRLFFLRKNFLPTFFKDIRLRFCLLCFKFDVVQKHRFQSNGLYPVRSVPILLNKFEDSTVVWRRFKGVVWTGKVHSERRERQENVDESSQQFR